jgi:Flp pilus assembly CpaF family ATPase
MSDLHPRSAEHTTRTNGNGLRRPTRLGRGRLLREVEEELRAAVVEALAAETQRRASSGAPTMSRLNRRQLAHATVVRLLSERFDTVTRRGEQPLSADEERLVRDNVIAAVFQQIPALEALLAREDVTEIICNSFDDTRVRTLDGREEQVPAIFASEPEMLSFLRAAARHGGNLGSDDDPFASPEETGQDIEHEFSATRPFLDLRLSPSGARLAAIGPWVTTTGTHISIRRHPLIDTDQRQLVEQRRMYSAELASFLGAAVRLGWRILISGRPDSGKTTLLRALAHELAPSTRIIQIEQNPELELERNAARHNQVVGLVERPANMEGVGAVTLDAHVRVTQRHVPDCLIVGEVRGAEVLAMLKALSMDVPGFCTLHARSSSNVFSRLVYYAKEADTGLSSEYVLRAAAEGLDLIVHLRRARDGRRVVAEVLYVGDFDEVAQRPITDQWYVAGPDGDAVRNPRSPIPADILHDLVDHGYQYHRLNGGGW